MLTIQRILHATDFSSTAKTAFQYAARLAHKLKIPLDVLHVLPGLGPARFQEVNPSGDDTSLEEGVRRILAEFRALAEAGIPDGVVVRYLIGRGPLPAPVILEEASHSESNVIVLGAHGQRSNTTPFLGSVAAELMQRSTCPVLMVPRSVTNEAVDEKIESVLTFVSFSHFLQPVIKFALILARLFEARLDVLALTETRSMRTDDQEDSETTRNLEKHLWNVVESQGAETGEAIPLDAIRLHLQSTIDVESILRFAREHNSDLFVVEAPGLGPIESPAERMLESIVNQSPCPVMLVNTCGKVFGVPSTASGKAHRLSGVV